ncbi:hypothetical protein ROHU_029542 [Labeo rohita]|uniref:Uncharacterized protein n=1 Tax=Labeo rohita TaxID=84645 RepID=A0A498LYM5_LABRO|nr:hypothetical protein ROHU_029542 [Labeo rohita]
MTWGLRSVPVEDQKALQRVVLRAQRIIGVELPALEDIYRSRCLVKAISICKDSTHPCHHMFELLPSGQYTVTTRNHKRVTIHRKKDMSHIPERKEQSQSPNTNVNLPLRTGQSISKEIQPYVTFTRDYRRGDFVRSTDLLQELGAAKKKLQATETRLNALETSQQKLMSRLANSEAQIEKVKMENKGRAKHFVVRNFYVDDGLTSVSTSEEAIALFRNTQKMLAESNLRLHKIPSNSKTVMKAFPKKDHAEDLKDLDLGVDSLPVQHSLGLTWNLETDSFNFHVHQEEKPFMRMGVLSTVNSLYDPLGFLAPVVV